MKEKIIVMCSEGRSGTGMLSSIAAQLEEIGTFDEVVTRRPAWQRYLPGPFKFNLYFNHWIDCGRYNGKVCGIKIFPHHVSYVKRRFKRDLIAELNSNFDPIFIMCFRKNKVRQAISLYRARETGEWSLTSNSNIVIEYNFEKIRNALTDIKRSETFWRSVAEKNADRTRTIFYEDFAADPRLFFDDAYGWLGRTAPSLPKPSHKVQSDTLSSDWENWFIQDSIQFSD